MHINDKEMLKKLFKSYRVSEVMKELSKSSLEVASDLSDDGFKDEAKELVQFSATLDDIVSGRPFLV
jgi:hypothetical protein